MKKDVIIAVLATVVIAFFALLIVGMVTDSEPPQSDYSVTNRLLKEGFVDGCAVEGLTEGQCGCMYDKLEAKVGTDGIVEIGLEYEETGVIEDKYINLVLDCMF